MKRNDFLFAHSAQGLLKQSEAPSACGSACGVADKPAEEKPSACGSACGVGEEATEEKPSACGSSCGAGEK